jgi:PAS domain S-box-containing protein
VSPGASGPIRVVLVDDSAEVRTLVRTRLRLSGLAVVEGEGSDGADAVDLARRLRPDAMLLDVSMPGLDGLAALPRVLETSPGTRVVMFSGFSEEALAMRALDLGAASYVTKTSSLDDVIDELLDGLVPSGDGEALERRAEREPSAEGEDAQLLDQQVERFRNVFEDAAIGMATMTLQGTVVRANAALRRMLGRGSDDLLGVSYGAAVDDEQGVSAAIERIASGAADVVAVDHPTEAHLTSILSVVRDSAGQSLYLFAQCQDVSREREAERGLRMSESRFRLLVEAVRDYAIFMLDPDGCISSWNAGAERIKGWSEEEILGQHFRIFYPADQQEAHHPEHELELALRDGVYEEEGWRVRKDRTRFWAHVTITTVRDEDGHHVGFAKVTRDHTERMQLLERQGQYANALTEANAELEVANEELATAAEEQARFLAVTAHELRSPVSVLSMSARMLADSWAGLDENERAELLAGMQSSAARLQRLLGDLLVTSRLQAATLEVDIDELDLAKALGPVLNRLRVAHPNAVIDVELPAGLRVRADGDRLAQMVDNLVANAVAHGASPIRVAASGAGSRVELHVSDAGEGVPAQLRPRLFQRFAARRGWGSTGLGLHIVRELARAQGGDTFYRPADNTFVVVLPAAGES